MAYSTFTIVLSLIIFQTNAVLRWSSKIPAFDNLTHREYKNGGMGRNSECIEGTNSPKSHAACATNPIKCCNGKPPEYQGRHLSRIVRDVRQQILCTSSGFFGLPDPTKYYLCVFKNGRWNYYTYDCTPGSCFQFNNQSCIYGSCGKPQITPAPPKPPPSVTPPPGINPNVICKSDGLYPYPSDPTKYIQCVGIGGKWHVSTHTCGPGKCFKLPERLCVNGECSAKPKPTPSKPPPVIPPPGINPNVVCKSKGNNPYPNEPTKYIQCVEIGGVWHAYPHTCPPGKCFNLASKLCDDKACAAKPTTTTRKPTIWTSHKPTITKPKPLTTTTKRPTTTTKPTEPPKPCFPIQNKQYFGDMILEREGLTGRVTPYDPADCRLDPFHECCILTSTMRPTSNPPTTSTQKPTTTKQNCVIARRLFGQFGGAVMQTAFGSDCPSSTITPTTIRPISRPTPESPSTTPYPHTPRTPCPGKTGMPSTPIISTPPTKRPITTTPRATAPTRPHTTPCDPNANRRRGQNHNYQEDPCKTTPRIPTTHGKPLTTRPPHSTPPSNHSTPKPSPSTPPPTSSTTATTRITTTDLPPTESPATTTLAPCIIQKALNHNQKKGYPSKNALYGRQSRDPIIVTPEFCKNHPNHRCCQDQHMITTTTTTSRPTLFPTDPSRPTPTTTIGTDKESTLSPELPLNCSKYHLHPLQCENHTRCVYDCEQKLCFECKDFTGCEMDCEKKICKNKSTSTVGKCNSKCFGNCPCSTPGCALNTFSDKCEGYSNLCKRHQTDMFKNECRRGLPTGHLKPGHKDQVFPSLHYIYSGGLCNNHLRSNNGNCEIEKTIAAVNCGFNETEKTKDQFGFIYTWDDDFPVSDPQGIKRADKTKLVRASAGGETGPKRIYGVSIWGDYNKKGEPHIGRRIGITYLIPLSEDGMYELILKMIDNLYNEIDKRGFDVYFNGILLLTEMDIVLHSGGQHFCSDWILNFKIEDGGQTLVMRGYKKSTIQNGMIELGFSYGHCTEKDEDFHLAGWAVNKFKDTGYRGRTFTLGNVEHDECIPHKSNACGCREAGCQFNLMTEDCNALIGCPRHSFKWGECSRANAFYSTNGMLCKNHLDKGNCEIGETILGVNFNAADHVDKDGIEYSADGDIKYMDKPQVRQSAVSDDCRGDFPEEDSPLYCRYIYAVLNHGVTHQSCLEYNFELSQNGLYELNIKMGEFQRDTSGDAGFSIRLNDKLIIDNLDLLTISEKNHPITIIFQFEVQQDGNIIVMRGQRLFRVFRYIQLQFCHGTCLTRHMGYTISAFSVNRFAGSV